MAPKIALLLCILFILALFALDFKRKSNTSRALWIPWMWMSIIGSRFVSQWFGVAGPIVSPQQYLEGSPLDRTVFLILIACGLFILLRREIDWPMIVRRNGWIALFILYAGMSVTWSDFMFVSFKRWTKEIGNIVMVLIVLTERNPVDAIKTLLRRFAYVLIPLSIVLYKYFPAMGRSYHRWSGELMITGVTTHKNELGLLCLICGLFFLWNMLSTRRDKTYSLKKRNLFRDIDIYDGHVAADQF